MSGFSGSADQEMVFPYSKTRATCVSCQVKPDINDWPSQVNLRDKIKGTGITGICTGTGILPIQRSWVCFLALLYSWATSGNLKEKTGQLLQAHKPVMQRKWNPRPATDKATDSPVRYIDMTYRLSIYRHFWKISISISISIWSYLKISISIRQFKKYRYRYRHQYGDFGKYRYRYRCR